VTRRIPTTRKKRLLQRLMPNPKARRRETKIRTRILRRRRLAHAITVRRRGTLRTTAGRRIHRKCLRSSRRNRMRRPRKQELQSRKSIFCHFWIWTLRTRMWNTNMTMTKESSVST